MKIFQNEDINIVLFHNYFSSSGEQPEQRILAHESEQPSAGCIAIYKTWGYHKKFEFMKSLGLCYSYVKKSWCGCVEHGLEYDTFYVKKHVASLKALFWSPLWFALGCYGCPHLWE